ncbi:MAG TPA: class I SAM-dependent methyltransferase [Gammaproteobacteria bacterium]|nr:class I SAM-dependent methyltransferase [Gammaproteobacteria bacterium]
MTFQDHFSAHAAAYAHARPVYPSELFDWLASQVGARTLAWDAGTGNGQAAIALATRFARVIATDASAEQISRAMTRSNVVYRVARAEEGIEAAPASVDLVTIAQALHWFERPAFYARVREVAKPGAVIAAWCYGLARITPEIDALVGNFYEHVVGPYWPPDRRWIEERYLTLEFPFEEIVAPAFEMRHEWRVAQMLAYLGTWSAVQRYARERGEDPLAGLAPALEAAWGGDEAVRTVRWSLHLRAGRVVP